MRLIKPAFLVNAAKLHPTAKPGLSAWQRIAESSDWSQFRDVRLTFRTADNVRVASGRSVVVFNIGGNQFRLICAIHYNRGSLYILRFLTHAEYSKDDWKNEL